MFNFNLISLNIVIEIGIINQKNLIIMQNLFASLPLAAQMATDDYVGFTFFVGCMAMMAASAFFFLSMNGFDKKWRTSILVSGLITFIAAVHYWYMRDYWAEFGESPTFFRYVDWILTVPFMCVEFYLILKAAGAKKSLMWRMIFFSVVMLVTGYIGEAVNREMAQIWGLISGLAYFAIVYDIWFVLVGWAIYPIGYMAGTPGWYDGIFGGLDLDIIYNIGDAVNKIGFGLVIYGLAVAKSEEK